MEDTAGDSAKFARVALFVQVYQLAFRNCGTFGGVYEYFQRGRSRISAVSSWDMPVNIAFDDSRGSDAFYDAAGFPVHDFWQHLFPLASFLEVGADVRANGKVGIRRNSRGVCASAFGDHSRHDLFGHALLFQVHEVVERHRILPWLILDRADNDALRETGFDHLHDRIMVQNILRDNENGKYKTAERMFFIDVSLRSVK